LASGGNPFFALELAGMVASTSDRHDAVALPDALRDVVGARVRSLPPIARACLAAAAALSQPTVAMLAELGLQAGVAPAEHARVIDVDRGSVRFTHPLLATAAYVDLSSSERATLHRRLADVVVDVEQRARHLALSADGPDGDVAAALDLARERALTRGDIPAAIDDLRLALDMTPPEDPMTGERRLALGLALQRVGDARSARRELMTVARSRWPAGLRARALVELASHQLGWGRIAEWQAREALELAEEGDDDDLLADAHLALATTLHADLPGALTHARRGIELLETLPATPPGKLSRGLQIAAESAFYLGQWEDSDVYWRRAMELDSQGIPPPLIQRAAQTYAVILKYSDDFAGARSLMQEGLRIGSEESDGSAAPHLVLHLAELEMFAGNLALAGTLHDRHRELAERAGGVSIAMNRVARSYLVADQGDLDLAEDLARQVLHGGLERGSLVAQRHGRTILGHCATLRGQSSQALAELEQVEDILSRTGIADPSRYRHTPDFVESLLATGRRSDAAAAVDRFEQRAAAAQRRSALGLAGRCRAMLVASDGDLAGSLVILRDALGHYQGPDFYPLDRARSLLMMGQILRRLRQKAAARDALVEARDEFDRIGSVLFAERARAELGRVGLRPAAPMDLTPTERRVAELIASGMKSKDVAAALFISTATVASNLGRVYRKLHITSRAELGALLGNSDDAS
jgi:DNA-binding CsgD family transcriptional regulator